MKRKALELELHHLHIICHIHSMQAKHSSAAVSLPGSKGTPNALAKCNYHTHYFSNGKERIGHRGTKIHCNGVLHLNGTFERNLNGGWHAWPCQDKEGAEMSIYYTWAQVNPLSEYTKTERRKLSLFACFHRTERRESFTKTP